MIRLGRMLKAHGPDEDPREMARSYREAGYTAVNCPEVSLYDPPRIQAIRDGFAAENVLIAEVGGWCNLQAADPDENARNRKFVCEKLALADEVGARCCVDYLGSPEPGTQFAYHPDNFTKVGFDRCVEVVRDIIDTVKPRRAKFCLEMMQTLLPDNAPVYLSLIKAVDRPAFAVHMDPANLIVSPRMYADTGGVIRECVAILGEWIISCHAKDLTLRESLALHIDEVRPGLGNLDYNTYLRELSQLPGEVPLLIEHLETDEDYDLARDHLLAVGREAGVAFA
jgi:sugar phosphate isomerase/epimerase